MGPQTEIDKYLKPSNKYGSNLEESPQCDCHITQKDIRQAENDIQTELENRQFEFKNEPNRYKRVEPLGAEFDKEAMYCQHYQPLGVNENS